MMVPPAGVKAQTLRRVNEQILANLPIGIRICGDSDSDVKQCTEKMHLTRDTVLISFVSLTLS